MNMYHLEKGKCGNLYQFFIGQLRALYGAEQQLIHQGSLMALTVCLMLIAAVTMHCFDQYTLKSVEGNYQSKLADRQKALQSLTAEQEIIQSNLTELRLEMNAAVSYISSLRSRSATSATLSAPSETANTNPSSSER